MYVLYSIYVLQKQNNDGISMDEEKTMGGGGWGGFPPLQKIYYAGLIIKERTCRGFSTL